MPRRPSQKQMPQRRIAGAFMPMLAFLPPALCYQFSDIRQLSDAVINIIFEPRLLAGELLIVFVVACVLYCLDFDDRHSCRRAMAEGIICGFVAVPLYTYFYVWVLLSVAMGRI